MESQQQQIEKMDSEMRMIQGDIAMRLGSST
jgi:hypothetical protein